MDLFLCSLGTAHMDPSNRTDPLWMTETPIREGTRTGGHLLVWDTIHKELGDRVDKISCGEEIADKLLDVVSNVCPRRVSVILIRSIEI